MQWWLSVCVWLQGFCMQTVHNTLEMFLGFPPGTNCRVQWKWMVRSLCMSPQGHRSHWARWPSRTRQVPTRPGHMAHAMSTATGTLDHRIAQYWPQLGACSPKRHQTCCRSCSAFAKYLWPSTFSWLLKCLHCLPAPPPSAHTHLSADAV